jgi:hypothetical protein
MESVLSGVRLVMFRAPDEWAPPTISELRAALAAQGFSEDRAKDIPVKAAFGRAVKSLATDGLKSSVGGKTKLIGQLDRLDEEGERLRREFVTAWTCDLETGAVQGGNQELPMAEALQRAEKTDCTNTFRVVLKKDGAGSYSLTPGVYVVPSGADDFLSRLQRVVESVRLRCLVYPIPDTADQRAEISAAVYQDLARECEEHSSAIAAYGVETREGTIRNRLEGINSTLTLMRRLDPYLIQAHAGLIITAIADLEACAGMALQRVQEHRTAGRVLSRE